LEQEEAPIQPPVRLFGISGRYATALFGAAVRDGVLDSVSADLDQVVQGLRDSPNAAMYLMDPTISKKDKTETITSSLADMNCSVQTVKLMGAMAENGRLGQIFKVADDFRSLVRAHKGHVQATVTSAQDLTAEQVDEIKKALSGMLKEGQRIELELKVDPEILGGLIVGIDDKRIDLSVVTRVKRMSHAIRTAFS